MVRDGAGIPAAIPESEDRTSELQNRIGNCKSCRDGIPANRMDPIHFGCICPENICRFRHCEPCGSQPARAHFGSGPLPDFPFPGTNSDRKAVLP